MTRPLTMLAECVEWLGYTLLVVERPGHHPDALGRPGDADAAVLSGRRIAVVWDGWGSAYAVSHEIAEHQNGFTNHEAVFEMQANILSAWHLLRSGDYAPLAVMMRDICVAGRVGE